MAKKLYRVRFVNEDKVYEIYAKHVFQGTMYGFVVIEGFVFGENASVVIDPGQERLQREFADVVQTHIPMHSVLRIDQVEKPGIAKIQPVENKITGFPAPIYTPSGKKAD
jgi:hypothetical protein